MIADTPSSKSDSDSTKSFDPKKVIKRSNSNLKKSGSVQNITSMDIISKNGYLFKQKKHNSSK